MESDLKRSRNSSIVCIFQSTLPAWGATSSRIHYCGAYAKDFKTWRVIDELTPKESSLIAWDDLEAYVDRVDEEARERHAES